MQKIPQRLATLAIALGLTTLVATVAQGQIYCGGTWTAACASGTVTRISETGIQFVFVNDPDALGLGGGDATNSVITEIDIWFAGLDGAAIYQDGNTMPYYPGMTFVGDGADWEITEDGRHPKKPDKNKPWFNSRSRDWSVGVSPMSDAKGPGSGLCGGLIDDDANRDLLPTSCQDDFNTQITFTFSFEGANLSTSEIQWDWQAQIQNVCAEGETECEYSDWAAVPEPITMVLVGSGLLGMGGAAWVRRRRRHIGDV
jgi:hypothetical protein